MFGTKIFVSLLFESIMLMHFPSPSLVFSMHLLTHLLCDKCLHFQRDLIVNGRGTYTVGFGVFLKSSFFKERTFWHLDLWVQQEGI